MARGIRRLFRGGRIIDLAAGHGLLLHLLLRSWTISPQAHFRWHRAAAVRRTAARDPGRGVAAAGRPNHLCDPGRSMACHSLSGIWSCRATPAEGWPTWRWSGLQRHVRASRCSRAVTTSRSATAARCQDGSRVRSPLTWCARCGSRARIPRLEADDSRRIHAEESSRSLGTVVTGATRPRRIVRPAPLLRRVPFRQAVAGARVVHAVSRATPHGYALARGLRVGGISMSER